LFVSWSRESQIELNKDTKIALKGDSKVVSVSGSAETMDVVLPWLPSRNNPVHVVITGLRIGFKDATWKSGVSRDV
jgi:hypothetical protein